MASVREAILRNCLLYQDGSDKCEISENCGDIVIKFPNGIVRRSRKGASGALYLPMQDGREVKLDVGGLLAA